MTDITNSYAGRCGEELDRLLNVALLDGSVGETVSHHAATAEKAGKRWACLLCAWLSRTVEKDHCAKTLAGESISPRAGVLAGLQLLAVALALSGAAWFAILR